MFLWNILGYSIFYIFPFRFVYLDLVTWCICSQNLWLHDVYALKISLALCVSCKFMTISHSIKISISYLDFIKIMSFCFLLEFLNFLFEYFSCLSPLHPTFPFSFFLLVSETILISFINVYSCKKLICAQLVWCKCHPHLSHVILIGNIWCLWE